MHRWDVSPVEAVAIQQRLRTLVRHEGITPGEVRSIAGVDASYADHARAAIVLLSFPALEVIEQVTAERETDFPYVPGLLSFREVPVVIEAMARLHTRPDLLIVDGHGYAHPRRIGIASHLGVYLDLPTIGCAKSRLSGSYVEPGPTPGDRTPLTHRGETIGAVLRTKARANPVFISTGHKIDLESAVWIVRHCLRGYRLPEPTRLADKLAALHYAGRGNTIN